jgi:hypothetical protein
MNTAATLVTQDPNDHQRSSWSSKEHPSREFPNLQHPAGTRNPTTSTAVRAPHGSQSAHNGPGPGQDPHHTAADSAHEPARGDGHETFPTLPELYDASRRNHATHGSTTACANQRRTATSEHSLRQPAQNRPTWLTIHTKTACRLRTLFLFDRCRRNELAWAHDPARDAQRHRQAKRSATEMKRLWTIQAEKRNSTTYAHRRERPSE